MFHYVIDQLRKFALPHKTNQSFTKIDPSFTVQDRLGFTPYSGQPKEGLIEILSAAGLTKANVVERNDWFCAIALKE